MNGLINTYGFVGGAVLAILASVFSYLNRDRYKTLINDIYKPGNTELREQLATEKQRVVELVAENARLATQVTEKEATISTLRDINSRIPDFSKLTQSLTELGKQNSANHSALTTQLTDLSKLILKKNA